MKGPAHTSTGKKAAKAVKTGASGAVKKGASGKAPGAIAPAAGSKPAFGSPAWRAKYGK